MSSLARAHVAFDIVLAVLALPLFAYNVQLVREAFAADLSFDIKAFRCALTCLMPMVVTFILGRGTAFQLNWMGHLILLASALFLVAHLALYCGHRLNEAYRRTLTRNMSASSSRWRTIIGLVLIDSVYIMSVIGTLVTDHSNWNAWRYVALILHITFVDVYIIPSLISMRKILVNNNKKVQKIDTLHVILDNESRIKGNTPSRMENKSAFSAASGSTTPTPSRTRLVDGESKMTRKLYWVTFIWSMASVGYVIIFSVRAYEYFSAGRNSFSTSYENLRPGSSRYTSNSLGYGLFHLADLVLILYTIPASNKARAYIIKTCCIPLADLARQRIPALKLEKISIVQRATL